MKNIPTFIEIYRRDKKISLTGSLVLTFFYIQIFLLQPLFNRALLVFLLHLVEHRRINRALLCQIHLLRPLHCSADGDTYHPGNLDHLLATAGRGVGECAVHDSSHPRAALRIPRNSRFRSRRAAVGCARRLLRLLLV